MPMIEILKIPASQIGSFADDPSLADWENIPISRYRAISYSHNPRSNPQDIVLYLAHIDELLVGYRTVMADTIFAGDTPIKVGWLSGNWVHNDYRRKGIASMLFAEAYNDWGNRLLYTNYALESKAVYDKSNKFELLSSKEGVRFYVRSCFATLLPSRSIIFKKSIIVLKIIDFIVNFFNPIPLITRLAKGNKKLRLQYLSHPDREVYEMFDESNRLTLTRRTHTELKWILCYPWLVSSPKGDRMGAKYFFSSNPEQFIQTIVKVFINDKLLGFLIINLNNDKLSVPYISFDVKDSGLMARVVFSYAIEHGASIITIYDKALVNAMRKRILFRLFSKRRIQNYFATKELIATIKNYPVKFNDGDGDCAFL